MTAADDHRDDIALAGEYALHLLDAEERRRVEARLAAEPALRALVRDWEEGLVPLAEDIPAVAPPPRLKADLEQALFGVPERKRSALRTWLTGVAAAGALAVAVAVAVVVVLPILDIGGAPEPAFVAEIAAEDGSLVVVARFVAETRDLRVERRAGAAPEGRVLELWLIAEGVAAPVSLGVLSSEAATAFSVPEALAARLAGGTFAISEEPVGGSPTGAPTGAVLALGAVEEA